MVWHHDIVENLKRHFRPRQLTNNALNYTAAFFSNDEATLFATCFFFLCLTTFSYPLITSWRLAFDTNVAFWFGRFAFWLTLPIPVIFIAVHVLHTRAARPKRTYMMFSIIVPCMLFFLV